MSIGPVEILVISFPGNKFNGDVAPALAELVQTGLIRVIDLVFVTKDAAGDVVALELSELDEDDGLRVPPARRGAERDARRGGHRGPGRRPGAELVRGDSPVRARVGHPVPERPSSTPVASSSPPSASPRKPSTRCSRPTEPAPPESTEFPNNPEPRGSPMLRRRGRPIMRTAAIVGTASAVGGSVSHHQQQKYAAQDAQAAAPAAGRARVRPGTAAPGRAGHHRRADAAGAAPQPGHPHRRGVLGQEGADPRHLSRPEFGRCS